MSASFRRTATAPTLGRALILSLTLCASLAAPLSAEPARDADANSTTGVRAGYVWPLSPRPPVARPFEPPPFKYGRGHRGADLAGAPGQQVVAAGAGVVAFAGQVAGRPVVSVDHADGLRTTYEPVVGILRAGDAVGAGAPIGTLEAGHLGCGVAACLHWGLRRGEDYLDPLTLVRVVIRLKPVDGPGRAPPAAAPR